MTERRKAQLCKEWLQYCRDIGWTAQDLPALVDVFWEHDGWRTFQGYHRGVTR